MTNPTDEEAAAASLVAAIKQAVSTKLVGFTRDLPDGYDGSALGPVGLDVKLFPVPELVLFVLRDLMGWRHHARGEKERWVIVGSVADNPIGFVLRKSGFALLRGSPDNIAQDRIVGQLQAAISAAQPLFDVYAQRQIDCGALLVVNRFSEFDTRYRFFRHLADKSFKRSKRKRRISKVDDPDRVDDLLAAQVNEQWRAASEGFFHSAAMVDCYFSALEHRLILLRAFVGRPMKPGEFNAFLISKWDKKLAAILKISGNREAELTLGSMRRIKERIRNPLAHGGVENDRGSLFVHFPKLGPLPANFSRHGSSAGFSLFPIEEESHSEVCTTFDKLDCLLSTGDLCGPARMLDAGVDPSYDAQSISAYGSAVAAGPQGVSAFVEQWGYEWDRHANLDY